MNIVQPTTQIVFALIFVGFAVISGYYDTLLDRKAVEWPQATAIILSYSNCDDPYSCGIQYEYSVDDSLLVGNRVLFSGYGMPKGWSQSEKRQWVKTQFPINKSVPVFYNHVNPSESTLLAGTTIESFRNSLGFFTPVIVFLFAALVWCLIVKKT